MYFAHDMVYSVEMWRDFLRKNALPWRTFCLSNKGREVPCLELGEGAQTVLLTSRHHACESTGTYVLQGVVEHWLKNPILGYRLMCVPFMDMDGVMEGDQGKARKPHDHNRDYNRGENTLYNEVRAIERYVDTHTVPCLFDFHSSWHISGDNDHVFFVGHSHCAREIDRLSALLEASLTSNALQYRTAYNFPANTGWNQESSLTRFSDCILHKPEYRIGVTLETCYFGKDDLRFTQERGIELGHCFGSALAKFLR